MAEDPDAYARQPGDMRIYNPENLPLPDILLAAPMVVNGVSARSLGYDVIQSAGMTLGGVDGLTQA